MLKLPAGWGLGDSQQKTTTTLHLPSLDHMTLLDHTHHNPTSLLAGSSLSLTTTQLVDINTKQILFELSNINDTCGHIQSEASASSRNDEALHGLAFVGSEAHVFVTCSGDEGSIRLWDTRESVKNDGRIFCVRGEESCSMRTQRQTRYALAVSRWCSSSDAKVAVLGSDGQLLLYDSRSCESPLVKCSVKREEDSSSFRSRFTTGGRAANPCIHVRECLSFFPAFSLAKSKIVFCTCKHLMFIKLIARLCVQLFSCCSFLLVALPCSQSLA